MNRDRIQGLWKQVAGKACEQWGKLIGNDLVVFLGERQRLAGKLQKRRGAVRDEAARWDRQASSVWSIRDKRGE